MKNIILTIVISAAVSAGIYFLMTKITAPMKIGFVKSGIVLQDYSEMKNADAQYQQESNMVQANLDTLKNRYIRLAGKEKSISPSEKENWQQQLGTAENDYRKYAEQSNGQMEARKQELTSKVLEKINVVIQEYAKKNNYNIVFGTTNDGSILYGNDGDDLTSEILKELNLQAAK